MKHGNELLAKSRTKLVFKLSKLINYWWFNKSFNNCMLPPALSEPSWRVAQLLHVHESRPKRCQNFLKQLLFCQFQLQNVQEAFKREKSHEKHRLLSHSLHGLGQKQLTAYAPIPRDRWVAIGFLFNKPGSVHRNVAKSRAGSANSNFDCYMP